MATEKFGFEDFITDVDMNFQPYVRELHEELSARGCGIEVKTAKSGYVVSYLIKKKTLSNYVFRKKGLIVRVYANHLKDYASFLESLPASMKKEIKDAPDCKRLIDPSTCNQKCPMGYDYLLDGGRYQKCRYSAFMFLVTEESKPFIKDFLLNEVAAWG